jgi:hypothetical protein
VYLYVTPDLSQAGELNEPALAGTTEVARGQETGGMIPVQLDYQRS